VKVRIILAPGYFWQGVLHPAGSVIDFPDEDAHILFENRFAVPVPASKPAPVIETTEAAPAPENAARRTTKPKPRAHK